jgi:hypothetical protein
MSSEMPDRLTKCSASNITAATSEQVDRVVGELNRICKTATFDFAIHVGKLIVDSFYHGDLDAWRYRGSKDVSFRKLATHPDLPMSPSALYRSVAIYEVCARLGFRRWKHVSTSHVRLVLPLEAADQMRLLQSAEHERWAVRTLRGEIERSYNNASTHRVSLGGRKPRSQLRRTMSSLAKCVDESDTLVGSADQVTDLSPDTVRSFTGIIERVRRACSTLEKQLPSVVPEPESAG